MSDPNLPAAEGDPPIIIQGGGSVNIVVPTSFTEETSGGSYQQAARETGGKDFKNGNVHLVSLQIDDGTPISLTPNSKITINYR